MEFCETMMIFTDESTFPLLNRHNPTHVRYWSRENLHLYFDVRTQYPQKLNVWGGGIVGEHVIGPFFINGNCNLNGPRYLDLLQQHIIPTARQLLGVRFGETWFQQDGCSAHNVGLVREYLDNVFPNRVISTRGTILWPARSPDLAPNDFYLFLKKLFKLSPLTCLETLEGVFIVGSDIV